MLGLCLNPPQYAVVFAADEKTAIQALDRLDPVLPLSPGRAERHGFEYFRHGTLSLYAALNTSTGEIIGQTVPRHTSAAFVEFLNDIVASQPRRREIHVIVDNLAAHKTKSVHAFLDAHPRVRLHFTPTYASWLNQVELWFARIERNLLARGIFKSIPDLARKIRRYITRYNQDPKPIRRTYSTPAHRITTDSAETVHRRLLQGQTSSYSAGVRTTVTTGDCTSSNRSLYEFQPVRRQLPSFEPLSRAYFVIRTRPSTCVQSETMFPMTWPALLST